MPKIRNFLQIRQFHTEIYVANVVSVGLIFGELSSKCGRGGNCKCGFYCRICRLAGLPAANPYNKPISIMILDVC